MAGYTSDLAALGADGYFRIQKESTYNTGVTNAMTDIAVKPDTMIKKVVKRIERENTIASRLKEAPQAGRVMIAGEIVMDQNPAILGKFFEQLLGASSDAGSATVGYTHTWLCPISGQRIATSMTIQQAIGANEADQFNGSSVTGMTLSSDNEGNQEAKFNVVSKSHTDSVSRVSSWSFSSLAPFYFGQTTITIQPLSPTAYDATTQLIKSYEFSVDLGYDTERYFLGDTSIEQPAFNKKPEVKLKVTIDADRNFIDWARALNTFKVILTTSHGTNAGSSSGVYQTVIEIPVARISEETEIKNGMERLEMDLEFDCGYGGTTTGSGSNLVMFELRHRDATAAYAG